MIRLYQMEPFLVLFSTRTKCHWAKANTQYRMLEKIIPISKSTVFQFFKVLYNNWEIWADWENDVICYLSELVNTLIGLNILENAWINCSDYTKALNMHDHLNARQDFKDALGSNKPALWIWHSCINKGYTEFQICLTMAPYTPIMPNIPQYVWTWLNIPECPWIYLKIPE